MATISNTPRPGYVWDSTDNVWYPIGVGAHAHTADAVGAIANTLVDAKGDLLTATADDTPARLAVGSNNQVLTADSSTATGLKWATGGKVLQVVSATYSTATSMSTATFTDTGLSITITPTLNTSKILILVSQPLAISSSTAFGSAMQLLRGATVVYKIGDTYETLETNFGSGRLGAIIPMSYLDSPATTSATTYKTQGRGNNATPTLTFQNGGATASIIALEIGA